MIVTPKRDMFNHNIVPLQEQQIITNNSCWYCCKLMPRYMTVDARTGKAFCFWHYLLHRLLRKR